jgi:ribosomal protein L35AE/L33A
VKKKLLISTLVALVTLSLLGGTALAEEPSTRVRGLGKVAEVDLDAGTLTVHTRRGMVTVHTDAATAFRIPGIEEPSLEDVQVGDLVAGVVERQEDGTLLALRIAVVPPKPERVRGWGRVEAVHGKRLVVRNRQGTFEVLTDKHTVFRIRGVEDPSIVDIEVGDLVAGRAIKQEDGTLLAKLVAVVPPRLRPVRALGRVEAIHGKTLAVENRRGTFEVHTDKDTVFRIRGIEDPSIVDVEVGDLVAGKVVNEADGTLLARLIAVVPPRNEDAP